MRSVRPFSFGEDFRAPPKPARDPAADAARDAAERARLEGAARDAFERGRRQGREEAEAETARRVADAAERLAGLAGALLAEADARADATEAEALAFFRLLAGRLAGDALLARPLAAVAEAGREAFRHLRGVPHLAARVHPDLVEGAEGELRSLARERGFEGRLLVIGDDEMERGDARLEWADGAVGRDRRALDAAVASALAAAAEDPLPPSRSLLP